jgi:hypothetical protein
MMPQKNVAVLGKTTWPDQPNEDVNFVMSHIQGAGEEQFAYYRMQPYTWLDWRHFYTANVSIKRNVLNDWLTDGFLDAMFPKEDGELAYRLNAVYEDGFKILYAPAAVATHHHPYSVKAFIRRQALCGSMAHAFLALHPEAAELNAVAEIQRCLSAPEAGEQASIEDYVSIIEGLKAWPSVIEQSHKLGSQNWHADLLAAVFELSYLEGFLLASTGPDCNTLAAYQYLLRQFQTRMSRAATIEVFGQFPAFAVI